MLRSALTLDASMTLQDALAALGAYPDSTDVIIRRREGTQVYWYAKHVGDIRRLATHLPEFLTHPLKKAFDLHEHQASESHQLELFSRRELEKLSGVLLDGEQVIGVLEPRPQMAAASRGRSSHGVFADYIEAARAPSDIQYADSLPPTTPLRRAVPKNGGGEAPKIQTISAYPRLDAPGNVAPGQQFDLTIGLSAEAGASTTGGPMKITTAEEEFDLVVQVVAEGFQAPDGVRHPLHVKRSRFQEAETKVRLIAPPVQELLVAVLEVEYSYQGNLLGRAWREIRVVPQGVPTPTEELNTGSTLIVSAPAEVAPDLTVTINESLDGHTLVWCFTSPLSVPLPSYQVETKFKQNNAQTFAIQEIKSVAEADGTLFINQKVLGIARDIADQMPTELWDVLDKVWTHVKKARPSQVPSLLLVSSEPYVPWELASTEEDYVDKSLVDAARPPLIGAQLKVGRWLPEGPRTPRGLRRPKLPPETNVGIKKMAVVVGDYLATSGQRPLPKAKEEGKTISECYPAVWVNATAYEVDQLLENKLTERGEPVSIQAVHFACHGEVNPGTPYNGIVLSDQTLRLSETIIRGSQMTRANEPFVFVNACQLGLSSEILADYGGLAGAFLKEGCRGFIAPLWSVDDQVAHDLALAFYEQALGKNVEVSEVMRGLRSRFDMKAQSPPSTFVAYVFYGHPKLVLSKA